MRFAPRSLALVVVAVLVSGCGASLNASRRLEHARRASSCSRVPESVRSARTSSVPTASELVAQLPAEVRRVAAAARLDDAELSDRAALLPRILLLQTEVGAAGAEVDCLADQLEDLQGALEDRENAFELTLTLSSIAVAALTAIIAGVIDLSSDDDVASPAVQIGGGVVSGALGVIAFFPPDEEVLLDHDRNLLRAVREGTTESDGSLSRFVLELLNAPRTDGVSPRDTLQLRWSEELEPLGPDAPALLYGDGGSYDRDALAAREVALEQLETEIQMIRQDLELLLRFLLDAPAR